MCRRLDRSGLRRFLYDVNVATLLPLKRWVRNDALSERAGSSGGNHPALICELHGRRTGYSGEQGLSAGTFQRASDY